LQGRIDLRIKWNIDRLLQNRELTLGMRVHSCREKLRLSQTKRATLYYAYNVFHNWAKTSQPHLKTKTLQKLLLYLITYTLIPKLNFCTCKELLSFFKYYLRRLKNRDRKKPRPLYAYKRLADPEADGRDF
jgi:hypothetical protein